MGLFKRILSSRQKRNETTEHRSATGYTETFLTALSAIASGDILGTPLGLGAIEIAAGHYQRAFVSAEVIGNEYITAAIKPEILGTIGRELIRTGDCVLSINVDRHTGLYLTHSTHADVRGTATDPRLWRYELTEYAPDSSYTRFLPASSVIHCRYAVEPIRPHRGLAPHETANITAQLATRLEKRAAQESGNRAGYILPLPQSAEEDQLDDLIEDLKSLQGQTVATETTSGGWGQGQHQAPQRDWQVSRLGMNYPESNINLRAEVQATIIAACGVPLELHSPKANPTAAREAWRRFLHGSIVPLGILVAEELSEKLETEIMLNFDKLFASDLQGRARAVGSLATAGVDLNKAMRLAGFDLS